MMAAGAIAGGIHAARDEAGVLQPCGGGSAEQQHSNACSVLELRQWQGGNGGSGSGLSSRNPRSRIIYNPTNESDQLLQLTFVQPLRLKRGALRRSLPAEAAIMLELTAFTQAGRTCIQLQHVLARLRPAVSGTPRSYGRLAAAPNAALVKCGAMLEEVITRLHARHLPAAGSGAAGWPRLLMCPGMMKMPHIIDSREVEHIYCNCPCCPPPATPTRMVQLAVLDPVSSRCAEPQ
jgi:hypothetical protein